MQKKKVLDVIYETEQNLKTVQSAKYFIAGAGGIGSEILKSLARSGAKLITILDYDRLEVINLNRGFLNGSEHAKKGTYKVEALKSEFKKLGLDIEIVALAKNIFDCDHDFVSQFDIIFCAVDSLKARKHLSAICVKAKKPMFDGGVQEFFGQAKNQIAGKTECYGCRNGFVVNDEPLPCSIRTIPQFDMHAVMWAKFILESVFNKFLKGRDEDLGINFSECKDFEKEYALKLFDFLFEQIVNELQNGSDLPDLRSLSYEMAQNMTQPVKNIESITKNDLLPTQKLYSIAEYSNQFTKKVQEIYNQKDFLQHNDFKNPLILDLIASLTNLRIYNFKITSTLNYLTKFDIQRILYNITPVISSSASIVAGLLITEAIKYLMGKKELLKTIWLSYEIPDRLNPTESTPADSKCFVCGESQIYIKSKVSPELTLKQFLDQNGLIEYLSKSQIILENIIFDSDDDEEELKQIYQRNLESSLVSLARRIHKKQDLMQFKLLITLLESEKTLNYDIEIENTAETLTKKENFFELISFS